MGKIRKILEQEDSKASDIPGSTSTGSKEKMKNFEDTINDLQKHSIKRRRQQKEHREDVQH